MQWIDSHCHLDAPEFGDTAAALRQQARADHVLCCVLPAVSLDSFDAVRRMAHAQGDAYCLGIHPLYVQHAPVDALEQLEQALTRHREDPHLVAVGEIGLDFFVPDLCVEPLRSRQLALFKAQLDLARRFELPVVLHSRRAVDAVHAALRAALPAGGAWHGIAHAFSGSLQQAKAFAALGLKLGFGGAATFERATRLRQLLSTLPLADLVLETDAPDMPPQWCYTPAQERAQGVAQGLNSPAELPRIGAVLAALRGVDVGMLAHATTANAMAALPRLVPLLQGQGLLSESAP